MDQNEARRRFAAARVGRLATVTPDGRPHVVPMVFVLVGDFLYTAVDGKPKTTLALQRLANIDDTARASILVDEYSDDWSNLWWVRVDGPARVLDVDNVRRAVTPGTQNADSPDQVRTAVESLTLKYPQYLSQPPPGPVIAVRLARWRWWEASPVA